jgi:hypothetical protein
VNFLYEKASIDASPQITATGFRARARLKRVGADDMVEQEKYAPDLGIFSTSDEAVNCARQWAITYYDQHWS